MKLIFLLKGVFQLLPILSTFVWLLVDGQDLKFLLKESLDQTFPDGINHECWRNCSQSGPMVCRYKFTVRQYGAMNVLCGDCPHTISDCFNPGCVTAGGVPRNIITANLKIPGPQILVCEDDIIEVEVYNGLKIEGLTIHWHGVHQIGTPTMDGVPFITQLPVQPYSSFLYRFTASPHGTHMWHGHSGFQESDGLYGILVIRNKEPKDISTLYDFDLPEHTAIVWHWYNRMASEELPLILYRNQSVFGFGLLINGKGPLDTHVKQEGGKQLISETPREVFYVQKGYRYRFRIIYNSAIYCPFEMSIDNHTMIAFASDASSFEPVEVDSLMMTSGERYDFVLKAQNKEGCYWIRLRAFGDCGPSKSSVHQAAILCYGHPADQSIIPDGPQPSYDDGYRPGKLLNPIQEATSDFSLNTLVRLTDLKNTDAPASNVDYSGNPNFIFYIQIHSKVYNSLLYPGPWHQFDNITFEFPGQLLSISEQPLSCYRNDQNCQNYFCSCTYTKQVPVGALVEMIFVDISTDRDQDHPVHLHGYQFYIVASGVLGHDVSMEKVKQMNEQGLINKKWQKAITKDSMSVPNMGYVVIRFRADNPGYWMLHCHVTNHMELGMAMLLQVGSHKEIRKMSSMSSIATVNIWIMGLLVLSTYLLNK